MSLRGLLVLVFDKRLRGRKVRLHHLLDERVEVDLALPAEHALGLGGVAEKQAAQRKRRKM